MTRTTRSYTITALTLALAAGASAQHVVAPTLLNATTNALTDDPAGLVSSAIPSSRLYGTDDPFDAFGNNDGPTESTSFIFGDGFGVGALHTLEFTTLSPVTLTGIRFAGGANSLGSDPRRITNLTFEADTDNNGSFETGLVNDPDFVDDPIYFEDYIFASPVTASSFRFTLTAQDGGSFGGPRISEIDAIVAVPEPTSAALLGTGLLGLLARRRRKV